MEGYTPVFDEAEKQHTLTGNIFDSFRSQHVLYGFTHNGDAPPDVEAEAIAARTDPDLFQRYREKNATRKELGYEGFSNTNAKYNQLDTRHMMMSVVLFHHLPTPVKTIAEIGGGFGNWLWLNRGIQTFDHWTIVDLPHVLALQKWYLDNQGVPAEAYTQVSAKDVPVQSYDLVIGSHSLSEFSMDTFMMYYTRILARSKYLFYAHHVMGPTPEMNKQKLNVLRTTFEEIACVPSEDNMVMNRLFRNNML